MGWLWSRLVNAALLFALLVLAIGTARLLWSNGDGFVINWREEIASPADIAAQINAEIQQRQSDLARLTNEARTMPVAMIDARINEQTERLEEAEARLGQDPAWFDAIRPPIVIARKKLEIEAAAIKSEIAVLQDIREPKTALEALGSSLAEPLAMPSLASVNAARNSCNRAAAALSSFDAQNYLVRQYYELAQGRRASLMRKKESACSSARRLETRRDRALQIEAARKQAADNARREKAQLAQEIAAVRAKPLPATIAQSLPQTTVRDIFRDAFLALLAVLVFPLVLRVVFYFGLAPLAEKWPAMRFDTAAPVPPLSPASGAQSRVSLPVILRDSEEALVRQDYLQSSSITSAKRTRWLLDWSRPITSWLSGMRFMTAIQGAGEEALVSAVKDPLAELAILDVPEGAAVIARPSALAGLVQRVGEPVRIRSHMRFSLPALLTFQFRYLAFQGPARLIVKGGRGVRIENARRGRIVGQGQLIGFSTDLSYSVIRTETFWPYFFGRESLLKDCVEEGVGVLLIEEAPQAGRSGLRRGFDGAIDAALKLFGV